MKELLFTATALLLLYCLLTNRSISNLIVIACAILVLIIYMLRFKVKYKENFTTTVSTEMYNDEGYEEVLPENIDNGLVYYVSSFDKRYIDLESNVLLNHKNGNIGALISQSLSNFPYDYYNQFNGIRVDKMVECANAKNTIDSFNTFSIFWYMKINRTRDLFNSGSHRVYSILKFDHSNISGTVGFNLINITLEFSGDYNPSICIYIVNSLHGSGDNLSKYVYKADDYFTDKIFMDNKYHLFTFVKNDGQLFFYVDNHKFINCDDTNCFNKDAYTLYGNDTDIHINQNSLIKINDNDSNSFLTMFMNAFGVYRNRALSIDDVQLLYNYFTDVKKSLSPDYLRLKEENSLMSSQLQKYTRECPFSNSNICNSQQCFNITDWRDIDTLTHNKECFSNVAEYCNNLEDLTEDPVCKYLKKDTIFKMASSLDSNLFNYNPNNTTNLNTSINSNVLHQLEQLGLKNIYLDKSYRDMNGRYSGEMQRLINDLLQTNQTVDISTLESLYDETNTDTNVTNNIHYNNLHTNPSFSNDMSYQQMYNDLLATESNNGSLDRVDLTGSSNNDNTQTNNEMSESIINLDYGEASKEGVYDNILRSHRQQRIENETNNSSVFNFFSGWF